MTDKEIGPSFFDKAADIAEKYQKWVSGKVDAFFAKGLDKRPYWLQFLQWITGSVFNIGKNDQVLDTGGSGKTTIFHLAKGLGGAAGGLFSYIFPEEVKSADNAKKSAAAPSASVKDAQAINVATKSKEAAPKDDVFSHTQKVIAEQRKEAEIRLADYDRVDQSGNPRQ